MQKRPLDSRGHIGMERTDTKSCRTQTHNSRRYIFCKLLKLARQSLTLSQGVWIFYKWSVLFMFLCGELTYIVVIIDDREHSRHASDKDRRYLCSIEPVLGLFEFVVVCEG